MHRQTPHIIEWTKKPWFSSQKTWVLPVYHLFAWANDKLYKFIYNRSLFLAHNSHEQQIHQQSNPPPCIPSRPSWQSVCHLLQVTFKGDLRSLLGPACRGKELESMVLSISCVRPESVAHHFHLPFSA